MAKWQKVRANAKRDANHNEIVGVFEDMGATWLETSQLPGELDGVVGVAGIDQRVEIKDGDKSASRRALTIAEQDTFEEWRGRTPVVVETVQDAVNLINQLRREAHAAMGKKTT